MKFLPYEHLKIITALSSEEVFKRLDNAIEPYRLFRLFESGTKPYQGSIEGSHFEVSRIIGYANGFLPVITGDVQSEISGCSISITMRPSLPITVFMIIWLGGVALGFLGILYYTLISPLTGPHTTDPSPLLIPAGMFAFGYALFLGGFKLESVPSKQFFQKLFEAREVEEMGVANPFEKAG
jgi:hypothetical protein